MAAQQLRGGCDLGCGRLSPCEPALKASRLRRPFSSPPQSRSHVRLQLSGRGRPGGAAAAYSRNGGGGEEQTSTSESRSSFRLHILKQMHIQGGAAFAVACARHAVTVLGLHLAACMHVAYVLLAHRNSSQCRSRAIQTLLFPRAPLRRSCCCAADCLGQRCCALAPTLVQVHNGQHVQPRSS